MECLPYELKWNAFFDRVPMMRKCITYQKKESEFFDVNQRSRAIEDDPDRIR